jgi:hypothetical protein
MRTGAFFTAHRIRTRTMYTCIYPIQTMNTIQQLRLIYCSPRPLRSATYVQITALPHVMLRLLPNLDQFIQFLKFCN